MQLNFTTHPGLEDQAEIFKLMILEGKLWGKKFPMRINGRLLEKTSAMWSNI